MSEQHDLPNDVFRDQVLRRFDGRTEPATVGDVARLYRSVLVLHDELMTITDVALNSKRLSITELMAMKDRHLEIVKVIGEGLLQLGERVSVDE